MSQRYSGKSKKDSSTMRKAKLSIKEKRKLKKEKKKNKVQQKNNKNYELKLKGSNFLKILEVIKWDYYPPSITNDVANIEQLFSITILGKRFTH